MDRRATTRIVSNIYWNADSWLPDKYLDPYHTNYSLHLSFLKSRLHGPSVKAYGDKDKFTEDLMDLYHLYDGFYSFKGQGSEHERLYMMLVDIFARASAVHQRASKFVIITKLSQDSEMICRALGSLRQRGRRVLFALPEVDVHQARTSFGITVCSEKTNSRIPIWLCPNLFDQEFPPQVGEHSDTISSYFIEPPPPDAHTMAFLVPTDVDTCVFWDVADYPLPPAFQLRMFCKNIISPVGRGRVAASAPVSIYAYVVKDDDEGFAAHNYHEEDAGFKITVVRNAPADKFARLAKITMDFLLWSMDNLAESRAPNLLVISRLLEDDILCVRGLLKILKTRGHNVFLALPAEKFPASYDVEHDLPLLSWESLLETTGKRKWGRMIPGSSRSIASLIICS